MIDTATLQLLLGLGAAYTFFGPQLLGLVKRIFTRPKSDPKPEAVLVEHEDPIVYTLYSLVQMRKLVASDPKAVEAIDTILTPAILRAEVVPDES